MKHLHWIRILLVALSLLLLTGCQQRPADDFSWLPGGHDDALVTWLNAERQEGRALSASVEFLRTDGVLMSAVWKQGDSAPAVAVSDKNALPPQENSLNIAQLKPLVTVMDEWIDENCTEADAWWLSISTVPAVSADSYRHEVTGDQLLTYSLKSGKIAEAPAVTGTVYGMASAFFNDARGMVLDLVIVD